MKLSADNRTFSIVPSVLAATGLALAIGCGGSSSSGDPVTEGATDTSSQVDSRSQANDPIYADVNVTVSQATDQNAPIEGVSVSLNNRAGVSVASGVTNSSGAISFSDVQAGAHYTVEVRAEGYITSNKSLESLLESEEDRDVAVRLIAQNAPITLAGGVGTVTTTDGVEITLGENAFVVESTGEAHSGDVTAVITEIDVSDPEHLAAYPASLTGMFSGGETAELYTFGVIDINFYNENGDYLQLASGQTADVLFPVSQLQHNDGRSVAAGDEIGLWTLDEDTGVWEFDSNGVVEEINGELFLRGTKDHFSLANLDYIDSEDREYYNKISVNGTFPSYETFDGYPRCISVRFRDVYGGWGDFSSADTVVCMDDGDVEQRFRIPDDSQFTGYCWDVQLLAPGTDVFNWDNEYTLGASQTFCQTERRANSGTCDYLASDDVWDGAANSENGDSCSTLVDRMGFEVSFGISYTLDDDETPIYQIVLPQEITSIATSTAALVGALNTVTSTDGEGSTATAQVREGPRLDSAEVCAHPARSGSYACE
jgi:hypothetical protein